MNLPRLLHRHTYVPEPDGRANKPKVTPLDEDKHIEDGIEVNET